jgi:uncharacterized membrane protein YphA (DoxX/SURF4 family)
LFEKKKKNMNIQQTSASSTPEQRQSKTTTSLLWIIQVVLALLFLFAGSMKLIMQQMSVPLPGLFVRFIGVAEVAGALGLILPRLLRMKQSLTPLAACGLVIIMIGATAISFMSGDIVGVLFPLVVGLLCIVVAFGRRSWNFKSR